MAKQYEIGRFAGELVEALPGVQVSVDRPINPRAIWWLDARFEGHSATVSWRACDGFGVSTSPADLFETRSDETYRTRGPALRRTIEVLKTGEITMPDCDTMLGRVRQNRRLSQVEVAKRMKIQQARVSRLERQSDMRVSSLAKYVEALGGRLKIVARFDEGDVELAADNRRAGERD